MSKDTIKVNMNIYDIPILVEQLKKLEQENKQLKEELENDIDRYEDTISYQLGFDKGKEYLQQENKQLKSILQELEEWLKETSYYEEYDRVEQDTMNMILNKIQELRNKYGE